jgi:hypothetical protein
MLFLLLSLSLGNGPAAPADPVIASHLPGKWKWIGSYVGPKWIPAEFDSVMVITGREIISGAFRKAYTINNSTSQPTIRCFPDPRIFKIEGDILHVGYTRGGKIASFEKAPGVRVYRRVR